MLNKNEKMNAQDNKGQCGLVDEANFETEVLQSKTPVLVAFWAQWSRPCQVLELVLEELARDWVGKVKVFRVNADHCLDLSLCFDIQSVPTLLYFVDGKPRLRIIGTATKEAIQARVSSV